MGVCAYKIGSGECNNYPLVNHIASYGKPVILSTGMNDIASITPAVEILRQATFRLRSCTVPRCIRLRTKKCVSGPSVLAERFPDAVIGLSDHSLGNYTCFAAVALGANVLEKHFTSDKSWPGPDVPISIDPPELENLSKAPGPFTTPWVAQKRFCRKSNRRSISPMPAWSLFVHSGRRRAQTRQIFGLNVPEQARLRRGILRA